MQKSQKRNETKQLSVIVPKSIYRQLQDKATGEFISLSALVRRVLVNHVNTNKRKVKK